MGFFDTLGKALVLFAILAGAFWYLQSIGVLDSSLPLGDPALARAQPYMSKVVPDDLQLRSLAASVTKDCPSASKECQVTNVFGYVVNSYSYYSDPRKTELIQSPQETIQVGGGDCEDFTILMNSLLENLGFKTYFVITDSHAYGLVCGVSPSLLRSYVEDAVIQKAIEKNSGNEVTYLYEHGVLFQKQTLQRTFSIPANSVEYIGGDGSNLMDPFLSKRFDYDATFSAPVNVHIVAGKSEYEKLVARNQYREYPCAQEGVISLRGTCDKMGTESGIAITNQNDFATVATLSLGILYRYSTRDILQNVSITTYELNNESCVVLDGTSGEFGYPGFVSPDLIGKKTVVDPETKQVWSLQ